MVAAQPGVTVIGSSVAALETGHLAASEIGPTAADQPPKERVPLARHLLTILPPVNSND